jgi:tetratricopeptide (TPR) repeat protein
MSRTSKYKLFYTLLVLAGFSGAIFAFSYFRLSSFAVTVIILLFLVPGRVQGFFYRDFHKGRHFMTQKQFRVAIPHFETFLRDLEQKPLLQHLHWLGASVDTRDVKAMTFNNLGSSLLELGKLDEARCWLEKAVARDNLYPLPYYNLALVQQMENNEVIAQSLLEQSKKLGLGHSLVDTFLQKASEILSRIEGRIS